MRDILWGLSIKGTPACTDEELEALGSVGAAKLGKRRNRAAQPRYREKMNAQNPRAPEPVLTDQEKGAKARERQRRYRQKVAGNRAA